MNRVLLVVSALLTGLGAPVPARAWSSTGALRLSLEPGFATVAAPEQGRLFGGIGAISAGVGVSRLAQVQLQVGHMIGLPNLQRTGSITHYAAIFTYGLDSLWIAPYLDLGVAYAQVALDETEGAFVPTLGAGLELDIGPRVFAGAGLRYYPLFQTALLGAPAYVTTYLRLGVYLYRPTRTVD